MKTFVAIITVAVIMAISCKSFMHHGYSRMTLGQLTAFTSSLVAPTVLGIFFPVVSSISFSL